MCFKTESKKKAYGVWSHVNWKVGSIKKPKKPQEYFKLPPLEEQAYLTQLSGKVTLCSLELLHGGRSSEP